MTTFHSGQLNVSCINDMKTDRILMKKMIKFAECTDYVIKPSAENPALDTIIFVNERGPHHYWRGLYNVGVLEKMFNFPSLLKMQYSANIIQTFEDISMSGNDIVLYCGFTLIKTLWPANTTREEYEIMLDLAVGSCDE